MTKVARFEDIVAWQGARRLVRAVNLATRQGPFAADLDLRSQLRRAAIAIMANIAEGFERGGNREFRRFLTIAKGSAGEVRALLYIALDEGYLDAIQHQELLAQVETVSRQLGAFVRHLDAHLQQAGVADRQVCEVATSYSFLYLTKDLHVDQNPEPSTSNLEP